MFISRDELAAIKGDIDYLKKEHWKESQRLLKRVMDAEVLIAQLQAEHQNTGPNPWTRITELGSAINDLQEYTVAAKSQRLGDLANLEPEKRERREFENRTIARLGDVERNVDSLKDLVCSNLEAIDLALESLAAVLEKPKHGKPRSKTSK